MFRVVIKITAATAPLAKAKDTLGVCCTIHKLFPEAPHECVQLAATEICGAVTALTSRLQEQGAKFLECKKSAFCLAPCVSRKANLV